MAKKAAAAPDYTAAAEKTGQSSKEVTNMQTYANRADQITPFGNQTWTAQAVTDPGTGQKVTKWVQNTTLDPKAQEALDNQQALDAGRSQIAGSMLNRVGQEFAPTMDWSKFGAAGANVQGGQYYDQKAGDALYNQFSQRNEPVFQQQQNQMETKLRNQGLNPGDEAYDAQMKGLAQQQNDARTNAGFQASQMAGTEGSRMQGMDIGASAQQTQNRQQQIAEEMSKRGFSLNEINGLLNGQQIGMPSMPSYNQATKSDAVNYSQAAGQQYSAAQDAANASNATIGGIAKLAGSGMAMMSDRRLKTNITFLGICRGLRIYFYTYLWGAPGVGVMADEIPEEFVIKTPNGYKMVNYTALMGSI